MMGAATRWLGRGGLALAVVVGMALAALGQQDSSGKNGNPNERKPHRAIDVAEFHPLGL